MDAQDDAKDRQTLIDELARNTEQLLRGPARGATGTMLAPDSALERWIAALLSMPVGLRALLRLEERGATLRLVEAQQASFERRLDLRRFCERAGRLGLRCIAWRGGVAEPELFQVGSLLLAVAKLPRRHQAALDVCRGLYDSEFRDVRFVAALPASSPTAGTGGPSNDVPEPACGRVMQALTHEAGRVLLHDIRGLPANSAERETLLRMLLALLSQVAREEDPETPGLFAAAVETLQLREDEWRTLALSLDPHSAESFLWAFLDQMPENPAPALYEAMLIRARDVLPTLLRHGHRVGRSGVRRIVELLLRQDAGRFEAILRSGNDAEVRGALAAYERAGVMPPAGLLQELTSRVGGAELRCQAARMLLKADTTRAWALRLLDDPVRELRRIALQALCGRAESSTAMIAADAAPETLEELRARINL